MWTNEEDKVIRKLYPIGGYKAVMNHELFRDGHRTPMEIENRACNLPIEEQVAARIIRR